MSSDHVRDHGWEAVPRSLSKLVASRAQPSAPQPLLVKDLPFPETDLAKAVLAYAKEHLPEPTYNHSLRVYRYGWAIAKQHFPAWSCSAETYLIASMLHDIGTTNANIDSTRMSFEFLGGRIALELLEGKLGAPRDQAEAVAETIIRHQDVGETGNVTTLTAIIHFATLFDNVGGNAELVHKATIEDVVKHHPRLDWTGCFASVIRKETTLKPWSHTTKIDGFAEKVEANDLMKPYD